MSNHWNEPHLVKNVEDSKDIVEHLCNIQPSHIAVCCVGENLGTERSRIRAIVIAAHPDSFIYHLHDENISLVKEGNLEQLLLSKDIQKVFHDIGVVSPSLINEYDILMDGTPIWDIKVLFHGVAVPCVDLEELKFEKTIFKKWTTQNEEYGKKMAAQFDPVVATDLIERGKLMWDLHRLCFKRVSEGIYKTLKKEIFKAAIPSNDKFLAEKVQALNLEKKGMRKPEKDGEKSQQQQQQQQQQKQQQHRKNNSEAVISTHWNEPHVVKNATESKSIVEHLCYIRPSHIAVSCVGENMGRVHSRIRAIVISAPPDSYVYHLHDENSSLVKDGNLEQLLLSKDIHKVFHDIGAVSPSLINEFDILMDGTPIWDIKVLFHGVTVPHVDLEELKFEETIFKKWTTQNEEYGKKMAAQFDPVVAVDLIERGKLMWDLHRLCFKRVSEGFTKKLKKEIFKAAIPSDDKFLAEKIKALKLEKKEKKKAEKDGEKSQQQQQQKQQQHRKNKSENHQTESFAVSGRKQKYISGNQFDEYGDASEEEEDDDMCTLDKLEKVNKNSKKKQTVMDLEMKKLSLDNERIKADINRIEKETKKIETEIECLELKKQLLQIRLSREAVDPWSVNVQDLSEF